MAQVKDPVCGMTIDSSTSAGRSQYQGQTYYFCSTDCKEKFDASPGQYAGASSGTRPANEQRPDLR